MNRKTLRETISGDVSRIFDNSELTELEKHVGYRLLKSNKKWDVTVEALCFLDKLGVAENIFTAMISEIKPKDNETLKSGDFLKFMANGGYVSSIKSKMNRMRHEEYRDLIYASVWG